MTPDSMAFSQLAVSFVRSLWIALMALARQFNLSEADVAPSHCRIFCSRSSGLIGFDI